MKTLAICAIFRNEARFLREWILWHRAVGVDRFFLFDHCSSDQPEKVLSDPAVVPLVTVNRIEGDAPQTRAYNAGITLGRDSVKWLAIVDLDEFLIPISRPRVPEILEEFETECGVCVNWVFFGSAGHALPPPEGVLRGYTRRAPLSFSWHRAVKAIGKASEIVRCDLVHSFVYREGRIPTDLCHKPVPYPAVTCDVCLSKLRMHHYCVRSKADFVEKMRRGRADVVGKQHQRTWEFFQAHDHNQEPDTTAAEMADRLRVPGQLEL